MSTAASQLTEEQRQRLARIVDLPLHRFLGVDVVSCGAEEAVLRLPASPSTINAGGVVHGGVLYALLDAVCYLALMPQLAADENAVTHDLHVSVLRPALTTQDVEFRGRVRQKGRSLVFADSEAWSGGKQVATARVTKTLVALTRP